MNPPLITDISLLTFAYSLKCNVSAWSAVGISCSAASSKVLSHDVEDAAKILYI